MVTNEETEWFTKIEKSYIAISVKRKKRERNKYDVMIYRYDAYDSIDPVVHLIILNYAGIVVVFLHLLLDRNT